MPWAHSQDIIYDQGGFVILDMDVIDETTETVLDQIVREHNWCERLKARIGLTIDEKDPLYDILEEIRTQEAT